MTTNFIYIRSVSKTNGKVINLQDRSMNEIKDTLHYQARHGTIPHSSIQESMGRIHASLAMEVGSVI